MTLSVEVVADPADLPADELHALDDGLGALGCPARLRQLSTDPRWPARYVVARSGGRLRAAVPVFLGHGTVWNDQLHSPTDWGHPVPPVPATSALVGGRLEIRGSLRCADDPAVLRAVADAVAGLAELRGREVFLGYLDGRQRRLAEAVFGPVEWLETVEDFAYPAPVVTGPPADLPREVRQTIRHGERRIAAHGIVARTEPWAAHDGDAAELIAAQNRRKGLADHPELVRWRMAEWDACDEVSVLVVTASAGDSAGAVTLLRYRDELEVYEVGLPAADSPVRRELYTCLTFHEPVRIAREAGLRTVRAGLGAGRPKRLRGAEATLRFSGRVLRSAA